MHNVVGGCAEILPFTRDKFPYTVYFTDKLEEVS